MATEIIYEGALKGSKTYKERLKTAGKLMKNAGLEALLLTKPQNMIYLTGDGRLCAFAIVSRDGKTYLAVPKTDLADSVKGSAAQHVIPFEDEVGMLHTLMHVWKELGLEKGKVGVEHSYLRVSMKNMLEHPHAKPADLEFVDGGEIMTDLRIIKSNEEIDTIRRAGTVAGAGMEAALESVKPGVSEIMVAAEAEYAMRKGGAEEFYRSYVASGPRSSISHGLVSKRRLEKGDLVMIDLHPAVDGYHADICRTVAVDAPSQKQQRAFDVYLKAQRQAVEAVKPGNTMTELENIMHKVFEKKGYEEYFVGPPIHGVGLEFEEPPLPAGHAFFHGEEPKDELKAGMVISIGNCGLYLSDFGVRVEDTVAVTPKGFEALTNFARDLTLRLRE